MWIIDPAEALAVIKYKARSRPLIVLSGSGAYAHKREGTHRHERMLEYFGGVRTRVRSVREERAQQLLAGSPQDHRHSGRPGTRCRRRVQQQAFIILPRRVPREQVRSRSSELLDPLPNESVDFSFANFAE